MDSLSSTSTKSERRVGRRQVRGDREPDGDFTLNTDFAQVEADEQQVNLTRFRPFFPQKREFSHENQLNTPFVPVETTVRCRHQNDD